MRDLQTNGSWRVPSIACMTLVATLAMTVSSARADGGEIAYIGNDRHSIHLVQPDGAGDRQLVDAADLGSLAWAPDGKLLAYTTFSMTQRQAQRIYLYDTASGGTTEVKSSIGTLGPIAFVPDGKRLVAVSGQIASSLHCDAQAVTIDLGTGTATPLVPLGACVTDLQVAPGGTALITTSHGGDPSSRVADVSLASGQPALITDPSTGVLGFSGVVAPDNQTLAYIALHNFDFSSPRDLVLVDRDGSNPRVVWQGQFGAVAFAPDGAQLAVAISNGTATAATSDQSIWIIGSDGSNPHQIASGYYPAWRPGQGVATAAGAAPQLTPAAQQPGAAGGTTKPSPGAANSPATPTPGPSQTVSCQPVPAISGNDSGWSGYGMVCDDGTRYGLNSDGSLISRYHASHPEAGMTGGPWPTTSIAMAEWEWVDPELHRTCYFFAGVTRSSVPSGNCHPTSDNSADAAAEPPAVAPPPANVAGGAPPSEDAPDTLTASQRADILSAIDRANAAWATASQSLNTSDLNGAVAGRELTDDLAELDKLRRQEQTRKNINTAFEVTNVTLDAPGHAIVRTHETWYAETYDATSGRLLQRTPPATYDETYTVEYLSGGWIVTTNDI